jgi:hypothetical protein
MPTGRPQPVYFDYIAVAAAARLSSADLAAIEARTRADYPNDQMMFELRMLRTCNAIASGAASVADALKPDPDGRASGQVAA